MNYKWSLDESNPVLTGYRKRVGQMEKWMTAECSTFRVPAQVIVKAEFETVPEQILKTAGETKADLIVVRAKVGRTAALMGGSVTRKILRQSALPVFILKSIS